MNINFGKIDITKRWDRKNNREFYSGDVIISIQENGYVSYDLFISDTDDTRKFLYNLKDNTNIEYTKFEDFFGRYAEIIDVIPYNKILISKNDSL